MNYKKWSGKEKIKVHLIQESHWLMEQSWLADCESINLYVYIMSVDLDSVVKNELGLLLQLLLPAYMFD